MRHTELQVQRAHLPRILPDNPLEQEDLEWALKRYNENHNVMVASAEVEYEGYCRLTRVEEIMTFARKMGYQK